MIKGDYGALYHKTKQIGGCFFWSKSEKSPICYWTSNWWLFQDIRTDLEVELYEMVKNKLQVIQKREQCKLVFSHKLKLDTEMRGALKIEII